jgi:predicted transcriptional regulator
MIAIGITCATVRRRDCTRGARGTRCRTMMLHRGALWCRMLRMAELKVSSRRSVSLPSQVARRVDAIAKRERTSASRVIAELIETGLEARERERKEFFELADRLARSKDAAEQGRIKEELARRTFGE